MIVARLLRMADEASIIFDYALKYLYQFIEHVGFIDEALDAGQARRSLDVRV